MRADSAMNKEVDRASFLSGVNGAFMEQLYERYLTRPETVDASWRHFFADLGDDLAHVVAESRGASWTPAIEPLPVEGEPVDGEAKPDGKWAKALAKIDSRPSYFAPMLDEKAPLSFSLSWKMDDREQGNTTEFPRVIEPQIISQLEPVAPAVRSLFAALNKTAETSHADAFFQFKALPPERMALYGGLKVEDGQKISASVRSILAQLKLNPDVGEMELDVDSHKGVSFHRIGSRGGAVSATNQRIFGGNPSVYIGTGSNVVWFALGDSSSLDATKAAIDELATARATVGKQKRGAPFQFVLNMSSWLDKMDPPAALHQAGSNRLRRGRRPVAGRHPALRERHAVPAEGRGGFPEDARLGHRRRHPEAAAAARRAAETCAGSADAIDP